MLDPVRTVTEACHPVVVAFDRPAVYLRIRNTWLGLGGTGSIRMPQMGRCLQLAGRMVALAILAGGCAAPQIGKTTRVHAGQVFCLRGLLDVFSLGLNGLAERLRSKGIEATAVSGPSWRGLAREIHRARLRGDLQGPLILIGHSHGADNAVRMARNLRRRNTDVELLVLLDATSPPTIPDNVVRCLHLYRPTVFGNLLPFLFAGNPVEPDEGNNRTQIVNEIVSREIFGRAAAHIGHFNIDAKTAVHDLVVLEVVRTCSTHAAWNRGVAASQEVFVARPSRTER